MTITIKSKTSDDKNTIVSLEWEKQGLYYVRVYEKVVEWWRTHESQPYLLESKATKTYYRYVGKYINK